MIVACGSDDEVNFTKEHFGDSKFFLVYEVNENGFDLIKKVSNESPEEKQHGDPEKAKFIAGVLNQNQVKAVFAYAMGPNIVRMRKKFLPIISRIENIEQALAKLQTRISELEQKAAVEGDKEVIYVE